MCVSPAALRYLWYTDCYDAGFIFSSLTCKGEEDIRGISMSGYISCSCAINVEILSVTR